MSDAIQAAVDKLVGIEPNKHKDIAEIKGVAKTLHGAGICLYCILRLLGVPHGPSYLADLSEATCEVLGIPSEKRNQACPLCLGVLDLAHGDKVAEAFKKEGFDADDLTVRVELPKSIYIRERSMHIFIKRSLHSSFAAAGAPGADVKETIKYMVAQTLSARCGVQIEAESELRIDLSFAHEETSNDHQFLIDREGSSIKTKTFRKRGVYHTTGDSKEAILRELAACSDDEVASKFSSPPPAVQTRATVDALEFKRSSLYVGGRYLKLERNISQTPFIIDNKRVTELSVSEVIGEPIMALVRSDAYNLVGSGREDADTIKPEDTSIIKEGEEHKTKHYCALVWFSCKLGQEKVDEINDLGKNGVLLQQKTPIRVLHRRAPLTRPKKLLALEVCHIEGNFYKVRIESEAGTYIKEFVHGDLGRTTPSLAGMAGATADILELDVENVSLDFPPNPVSQ
ncbi:hypothetical protein GGI12_003737 [Dipsacomyces acuminosporus]|nr:hypothetical protein GGI12_003737 [Dipsacomyces acuminosporus]